MNRLTNALHWRKNAKTSFPMLRLAKTFGWLAVSVLAFQSASAISFWGPKEGFESDNNGYDRMYEIAYPANSWILFTPEFTYAPHNLQEEFRWNVPVLYYTFDASFLEYFGSNGVAAVDSAMRILNSLPKASDMSSDLSEFPLDEAHFNFSGNALHLFDLKSAALEMVLSRLGLADPERWTWCVRSRQLLPGAQCPVYDYTIIQRNFDPLSLAPSKYVNGNLFTYQILQLCPPGFPDRADALEFLVDPLDTYQTAVASPKVTFPNILYYGMFYTGLTRDDAGSIRYLYHTNNVNQEVTAPDVQLFQTNFNAQLLVSSNLTLLQAQALTNDAVTLAALYPNLVITSTTNTFSILNVTNITPVFTTPPWAPAGTFFLSFITNVTPTAQTLFHHTFGNLAVFQLVNGQWVTVPVTDIATVTNHNFINVQTSVVTNAPWAPAGTFFVTNNFTRTFLTNSVSGEFFILPSNFCDITILAPLLTNVISTTNTVVATNSFGFTNVNGQFFAQSTINFSTNHTFVVLPVTCVTNSVALRHGLDKISFVRHDYDPIKSRFFRPITNDFTDIAETTNGTRYVEHFRRVITRPDILFTAGDIPIVNNVGVETVDHINSAPFFNGSQINSNPPIALAGPGTIEGPVTLTFNKVGPVHLNFEPGLGDEVNSIFYYQWASFDATTNAPFLYPESSTIADLESQVFIQVSPGFLPAATFGTNYSVALSVTGGQPPYTWSLGPTSGPLPPGLSLTQDPTDSSMATLAGSPSMPGQYLFTIRVVSAGGLSLDTVYVLTVN